MESATVDDLDVAAARFSTPLASGNLPAATSAAWDAFVEGCRDATFFHRAGWREILERGVSPSHPLPARGAKRRALRRLAAGRGPEPIVRPCARFAAFLRLRRTGRCRRGRRERADRCSGGSRATLARAASRVAQPGSEAAGLAAAGSLRDVPQAARRGPGVEHAGDSAQAARDGAQGHQPPAAKRDRWRTRSLFRAVRRQRASARNAAAAEALFRRADEGVRRCVRGTDRHQSRRPGR